MDNPLVSIIVITYNSAKYVLETLESAKAQTYKNIELIISDDCSIDNTVEKCSQWINKNRERFIHTELITSKKNTGTAPNINRGLKIAKGEWIKIIAGDDALLPELISRYINFIKKNPEIEFIHSNIIKYRNTFDDINKLSSIRSYEFPINQKGIAVEEQFKILLRASPIWASTVMIKSNIIRKIGDFNENYPLWEDRPMWLNITKAGVRLHYLNIEGAKYRLHYESVQHNDSKGELFNKFQIDRFLGFKKLYLKYLPWHEKFLKGLEIKIKLTLKYLTNNKKSRFTKLILLLLNYILYKVYSKISPSYY